uniref:Tubulin--tyrosine ligase-like protein 9 n=1 Tax=Echinococcus canadensis TaxID=519352 RepID=A0A915EYG8_9CEST
MVRNLKRAKKKFEKETGCRNTNAFDFMPSTFELPMEYHMFLEEFRRNPGSIWIMKPVAKSQGKGIFLFRRLKDIEAWKRGSSFNYFTKNEVNTDADAKELPEHYVVSRYIDNPYLIGGRKFDLRVYVLVTSFQPLKAWVYRDGFARLSNVGFSMESIDDQYIHLTNVAIQKTAPDYDAMKGCKWSICRLRRYMLAKHGFERVAKLFWEIDKIFILSLLSVQKVMISDKHCFELYGYDILVDNSLKPWLLEINASPSLTASSNEDYALKVKLLGDTLNVVDMEGRLNGDERRIGDFDCVWDGGPVAPIANASKSFLCELQDGLNPAVSTGLQFSHQVRLSQQAPSGSTGNSRVQQNNGKKNFVDWLPLSPLNSYLGCLPLLTQPSSQFGASSRLLTCFRKMPGEIVSPTVVMSEYACNLEKKQRNLLKRKARLESYKEILRNGGCLTSDQEKAVAEYDSVCQQVDALKETTDVITEMQVKVEGVMKENETRMIALREKYTIDTFRKICPILELLSKVQLPAVKEAVIKASSPNQFKVLEGASRVLNFRLPNGFKIDDMDSSDLFKRPAEYLFKLANGVQASVNGKGGKSRSATFAELRQTCLDLLSNEFVRSALVSPLGGMRKDKPASEHPKVSGADQSVKSQGEPVCNVAPVAVPEKSPSSTAAFLPAEAILNSVIDPLKTNFNFLQASQVTSVRLSGEQSAVHSFSHPVRVLPSIPQEQSEAVLTTSQAPVAAKSAASSQKSQAEKVPMLKVVETVRPPSETVIAEKPKSKQKPNRGDAVNGVLQQPELVQSQPTSLQAVIDAEIAQQQVIKSAAGGAKSWADCVRGTQAPQVSELIKAPTHSLPQQSPIGQNEHRGHQPLRGKSAHPREPQDHRPSRPPFNEGEANSGRPGFRGGFRGGGRGRGNGGMSFRGGRGRGTRGSFYLRGGFAAQARRQPSVEAAS